MGSRIDFAIDKNLDLAIEEPVWKDFFHRFLITPSLYTDMHLLTEEMKKNKILLSYLPTGNFFYFRKDRFYTPIANAIFSATNSSQINSLLIVRKDNPVKKVAELKGKTYGYIHPYCTSSYFSIVKLLWKNGFSIHDFFSSMQEVGAWQLQIDAVISGKIEATMVSEDIWNHLPSNAKNTKIIAKATELPSPLILVGKQIKQPFLDQLKNLLFSYKTQSPDSMFNGFIPFQKEQTENFFSEIEQALNLSK